MQSGILSIEAAKPVGLRFQVGGGEGDDDGLGFCGDSVGVGLKD